MLSKQTIRSVRAGLALASEVSTRSFQSSAPMLGGGGGRPGGVPTLNWKQKLSLNLEKKSKASKLPIFGDVNDLEKYIDLSEYTKVDLSKGETFSNLEPYMLDAINNNMIIKDGVKNEGTDGSLNHQKTILASSLFGPSKPAYAIPLKGHPDKRGNIKRKIKYTFSHKRIFGDKISS